MKHWTSEEEIADLQSFDIGLMPLVDDPSSWEVWPQNYSIPGGCSCSHGEINQDLVEDGSMGFELDSRRMGEKLSVLIENHALRKYGKRRKVVKHIPLRHARISINPQRVSGEGFNFGHTTDYSK
jgi:hypothetical protein